MAMVFQLSSPTRIINGLDASGCGCGYRSFYLCRVVIYLHVLSWQLVVAPNLWRHPPRNPDETPSSPIRYYPSFINTHASPLSSTEYEASTHAMGHSSYLDCVVSRALAPTNSYGIAFWGSVAKSTNGHELDRKDKPKFNHDVVGGRTDVRPDLSSSLLCLSFRVTM